MRELKGDWRDIFLGFSIARDPRKVFLATVGFILTLVIIAVFANLAGWADFIEDSSVGTVMHWARSAPVRLPLAIADHPTTVVKKVTAQIQNIHWERHTIRKILFVVPLALVLLALWSYIWAAICRIAAIEFAKDERIELREARKFANKKWLSLFWGMILPVLGFLFFAVWILLGGFVGNIPEGVGTLIVGLLFWLALLAGFLMTLILIGGVAGSWLIFPGISTEGTDAFDGISRAYSYVYTKPWRYIFYTIVAAAYGLACTVFVFFFVWLMVELTLRTGYITMHSLHQSGRAGFQAIVHFYHNFGELLKESAHGKVHPLGHIGAVIAGCFCVLAYCIAWGFAISMDATLGTIVYFLMRKAVDGTEVNEIYIEEEEEEFEEEITEVKAEEKAAEEKKEEEKAEEETKEEEGNEKKSTRRRRTTRRRKQEEEG